jgi:hypothetical protein
MCAQGVRAGRARQAVVRLDFTVGSAAVVQRFVSFFSFSPTLRYVQTEFRVGFGCGLLSDENGTAFVSRVQYDRIDWSSADNGSTDRM